MNREFFIGNNRMSDVLWKKKERDWAKLLGGERVLFGGTNSNKPVDVSAEGVVVDVKSTHGKKSISIDKEDLEDIVRKGKELEKLGIIGFQFYNDTRKYVVMDFVDFKTLLDIAIKHTNLVVV